MLHDGAVSGDDTSLMQQLKISVLPIGTGSAPNDRTRMVGKCFAIAINLLAVALHIELL